MPQLYAGEMVMRLTVSYTPYAKYSGEKIGDIITFAQFEEIILLSKTHDNKESGNNYDDYDTMPPLIG